MEWTMKQIPRSLYEELLRLAGDGCPLVNLEDCELIDDPESDIPPQESKKQKRRAA